MKDFDIFINNEIYPDVENIFNISTTPIKKIKDNCIYVIDTNALLLPYTTSSRSLEEIKKVFAKLISKNQLIIPGQVAREFANNRPEKLKEIFQKLNRKRNEIQTLSMGKYPLLDGISEYEKVLKVETKINELFDEYRKTISKVVDTIKAWAWNDPVSIIYKELFTKETILDIEIQKEEISKELNRRYLHKIPPGYKDENKPDDGIGDLLIWLTILEIAKQKKNVIFVSGDEKSDWFHRSEKQALYPRFELVNEFRQHSENKDFHIIKLFELLNLFDVDDSIIKEVEIEEKISSSSNLSKTVSIAEIYQKAEHAIIKWIFENFPASSITQKIGFPEIVANHSDKSLTGAEILILNSATYSEIQLREKFLKIGFEFMKSPLNRLLSFVIVDSEVNEEDVVNLINKYRPSKLPSDKEIIHIVGYLTDHYKFIETRRL